MLVGLVLVIAVLSFVDVVSPGAGSTDQRSSRDARDPDERPTSTTAASSTSAGDSPVPTEGARSADAPAGSEALPSARGERFSQGGVPALLFASNRSGALGVLDLNSGFQGLYAREAHTLGRGVPVERAVITDQDLLIIWRVDLPTVVYPLRQLAEGEPELVTEVLQQPGRRIHGFLGRREVVPTDSGDRVWIQSWTRGSNGRLDAAASLELLDVETADVDLSTTLLGNSRLVDVIGEDAVIAVPGSDVFVLSPSGEMTTREAPEPATFITATPDHTVWATGDASRIPSGDRLLVVPTDGDTIEIPAPDGGYWTVAWPLTRFGRAGMPTITADGTRLLLRMTKPNGAPEDDRLAVVDIDANPPEVRIIDDVPDLVAMFWARDDRTAIIVSGFQPRFDLTTIDTVTGATTMHDALPSGFSVVAGR